VYTAAPDFERSMAGNARSGGVARKGKEDAEKRRRRRLEAVARYAPVEDSLRYNVGIDIQNHIRHIHLIYLDL
jgi:hypothetical protein